MAGEEGASDRPPVPPLARQVHEGTAVTTAELFFDLVFVLAFIQVINLMTDDFTALGILRGLLVLTLLWWSWSASVWFSNAVRGDFGLPRFGLLAATLLLFVLALATREAFNDFPGGLNGPLLFATVYLLVQIMLLSLRWYATLERQKREQLRMIAPTLIGVGVLYAAVYLPNKLFAHPWQIYITRTAFWALAVLAVYLTGIALPDRQKVIPSGRHWAERHGLIIIIALGESLISIGLTSATIANSWPLVWTGLLGITITAALEWLYFDVVAVAGERSMLQCPPERQIALARDGYNELHLPMIAGIMLFALGMKKVLEIIGNPALVNESPLEGLGLYSLYGGVILFLLGHTGFQWRITNLIRTIIWPRLTAAVLLVVLLPVASALPVIGTLGLLAGICVGLVAVEVVVANGQRHALREDVLLKEPEGPQLGGPEF